MMTSTPNSHQAGTLSTPSERPSPGNLLTMVCEAAQRFLAAAEASLSAGYRSAAAANIRRAQSIFVELLGAMDRAVAPEITDALSRVCQHLIDRLSEAAGTGDAALLNEVRFLLAGLRDAWARTADPGPPSHAARGTLARPRPAHPRDRMPVSVA